MIYTRDNRRPMADFRRQFPDYKVRKPNRVTGHNRAVVDYGDGAMAFILHATEIVSIDKDGNLYLYDGGWATRTTRKAMAEGVFELTGKRVAVYTGKKKAHVFRDFGSEEEIEFDSGSILEVENFC